MAQLTTALSTLETRLAQAISDDLEILLTTAIAANNSIISTNLTSYDGGRDSYFVDWWVYITDYANAGIPPRQVSAYTSSTGTLTVRGTALATDGANLATIRIHRHNRDKYVQAFNDTSRELYGRGLFWKELDVIELVTGNILPNSHFRDWTASTIPDKYTLQDANISATASTTAGTYRGGGKSMKAATGAGGAGKYVYISSDNYPRLLDLAGQTVNMYVWALPEAANDAYMEIYTVKADGTTTQTLTSTTANPAGEFTLLKLESQAINKDIVELQVRFKVATASKYVYFDHARVTGGNVQELLLPTDFQIGAISNIEIQSSGSGYGGTATSAFACDDLHPTRWSPVFDWDIISDGTDKSLKLGQVWGRDKLIRLRGKAPLSTLSAFTDTIEIGGEYLNTYIAYAKYKLFQAIESPVSSQDIGRYETQAAKAYGEFMRLSNIRMTQSPVRLKIRTY